MSAAAIPRHQCATVRPSRLKGNPPAADPPLRSGPGAKQASLGCLGRRPPHFRARRRGNRPPPGHTKGLPPNRSPRWPRCAPTLPRHRSSTSSGVGSPGTACRFRRARVQHGDAPGARLELFDQLGCAGEPATVQQVRSMSQHFYGNVAGVADPLRFSARLTATYVADVAGIHRLGLASAGSARLLLDGTLVASTSSAGSAGSTLYGWGSAETVVEVELAAARAVEVVVEFDRDTDTPLGGMLVGLTPPTPPISSSAPSRRRPRPSSPWSSSDSTACGRPRATTESRSHCQVARTSSCAAVAARDTRERSSSSMPDPRGAAVGRRGGGHRARRLPGSAVRASTRRRPVR